MAFAITSTAQGTTGNHSISGLTFLPSYLRFTISGRVNTDETVNTFSTGFTDGTLQKAHSTFRDSTGAKTRAYTDRCVNHIARVAGSLTNIIQCEFVSFDNNGGGDYGFTLHWTAADSNYSIHVEAFA